MPRIHSINKRVLSISSNARSTFAPVADFFMLIGLLTGHAGHMLFYYGLFMLVDAAVSVLAFHFEQEKKSRLLWLLPQRLMYRWLMLAVLFKALLKAIKGELQGWGVLKRTGACKKKMRPMRLLKRPVIEFISL